MDDFGFGDIDSEIDDLFSDFDAPQNGSVVPGPGGDALQPNGGAGNGAGNEYTAPSGTPTAPPASGTPTSGGTSGGTTTKPVPNYGDDVYDTEGNYVGSAKFDPNTGEPLEQTNEQQLKSEVDNYQVEADKVSKQIKDIQSGVIPLTEGEQAQIDGLEQQFQLLIEQQKLVNTSAQGTANIRGYQTGSAEYDPTFQTKVIGSIITAGINKIADLNIKMASSIAELTQSFKDHDIAAVKDAWEIYSDAEKERTDYLQKTIDDATDAMRDARDFAYKVQQDALDRELEERKLADKQAKEEAPPDPEYKGESLDFGKKDKFGLTKGERELQEVGFGNDMVTAVQNLLNEGYSLQQIAEMTGIPNEAYLILKKYLAE